MRLNGPYLFPSLGGKDLGIVRIGGPGLGNTLFPWARAFAYSKRMGYRMITPTWPSIKIGPILRGESDLRFYGELFSKQQHSARGWEKFVALLTGTRVSESELYTSNMQLSANSLVVFEGMANMFDNILDDRKMISDELISMTRAKHLAGYNTERYSSLILHVRLGDFASTGQATPVMWFVRVIESLRKSLDERLDVMIFSDGDDTELHDILSLPYTKRASFGSSIADMLAMSRGKILVGSRGSTFSMWAWFIGSMPCLFPSYDSDGDVKSLYAKNIFQWDGKDKLPDSFIASCRRSLDTGDSYEM